MDLPGGEGLGREDLRLEGHAVGSLAGSVRRRVEQLPHGVAADLAAVPGGGDLQMAVCQLGGGVLRGLVNLLLDLADAAAEAVFIPLVGKDLIAGGKQMAHVLPAAGEKAAVLPVVNGDDAVAIHRLLVQKVGHEDGGEGLGLALQRQVDGLAAQGQLHGNDGAVLVLAADVHTVDMGVGEIGTAGMGQHAAGAVKHHDGGRRGARDNLSRFSNFFLPLRGFRQPLSRLRLYIGFTDRFHFEALLNHKSL